MSRYKRKTASETEPKPDFALAVRELRLASQMSQHGLALALGTADNTVARWEMGNREPDKWNYLLLYRLALDKKMGRLAGVFRSHLDTGITTAARLVLSALGITPGSAQQVYSKDLRKEEP